MNNNNSNSKPSYLAPLPKPNAEVFANPNTKIAPISPLKGLVGALVVAETTREPIPANPADVAADNAARMAWEQSETHPPEALGNGPTLKPIP